jgi:enoyl-CoA hydratase/carnithine racemase
MQPVCLSAHDGVGVITLRSAPANALGDAVVAGLRDALDEAAASGLRCLLLISAIDGFFAAGADLKLLAAGDAGDVAAYLERLRAPIEQLAALEIPSIAVIDGHALGGGLELALACSLRVAGPRARLGLPEIRLGLLPGAGGTQRLPRLIGRGAALELLLTGRSMDAQEALSCGLVDRVDGADAAGCAQLLATRIAAHPAGALAAALRCVRVAASDPLARGLAYEAAELRDLFAGADAREGLAAFVAKRPPAFPSLTPSSARR